MKSAGLGSTRENDASMAARAAWLHYAGGLTQAEVARRLGLTNLKAHRLITRANQEGLVKVYIDGNVSECVAIESELSGRYGLDYCEVVPDFDSDDLPLKALGIAGAQFLKREIERRDVTLIGVGHGRTLAACIDNLPKVSSEHTDFVSLLGGFSRKFSANPHDVIHRLADITGAQAYVMPVPFFANSARDRELLLGQRGIREVMELARQSSLKLVGIGTAHPSASLVANGMIEREEIEDVKTAGGVGEMLGHFFSDNGDPVESGLSNRTMSLSVNELKGSRIVAVAGGMMKARAIRSILASRFLSGLITDERTARALVAPQADA